MQIKVDHAQRRPKVIILCDKPTELAGAVEDVWTPPPNRVSTV